MFFYHPCPVRDTGTVAVCGQQGVCEGPEERSVLVVRRLRGRRAGPVSC